MRDCVNAPSMGNAQGVEVKKAHRRLVGLLGVEASQLFQNVVGLQQICMLPAEGKAQDSLHHYIQGFTYTLIHTWSCPDIGEITAIRLQ